MRKLFTEFNIEFKIKRKIILIFLLILININPKVFGSNTIINKQLLAPPSISGRAWLDLNGNGQEDAESGFAGIVVTLYNGATGLQVGASITTPASGMYSFTSLAVGNYYVHFSLPGTYHYSSPGIGSPITDCDVTGDNGTGTTYTVSIAAASVVDDIDAGFFQFGTVSDLAWIDDNANGIQDGEPGLDGIPVAISGTAGDGSSYTNNTTTSGGGNYSFTDVPPGTNYTVTFGTLSTYNRTYQNQGTDDLDSDPNPTTGDVVNISVTSGQVIINIDAGYYLYGEIHGYTWDDLDGDGQQDAEPSINGVAVMLSGSTGNGTPITIQNTTSSGGGLYQFINIIPGTYTVTFNVPVSYDEITVQNVGSDQTDSDADPLTGNILNIVVKSDEIDNYNDAGFFKYIKVGDFVWEDMNGNGQQDAGEPGVAGVNVRLEQFPSGTAYNTTTNGAGNYTFGASFKIPPGNYYVHFTLPAGYYFTGQDQSTDNTDSDPNTTTGNTTDFDLESGEENYDWDAGLYRPASIGNYCWRDQNTNGLQDAGEPDMPNVKVNLYNNTTGAFVDSEVTDAAGAYEFTNNPNIKPGEYYLVFDIPATFLLTSQDVGADDEVDSDPDPSSGQTANFIVESGETANSWDAGFYVEPPTDCSQPTAQSCEEAVVLCELSALNEFCTVMSPTFLNPPIHMPGCPPNDYFHNPSWFAFVAGASQVSLIIHATNCSGSSQLGIQYGFYDDCDLNNLIDNSGCDCSSPGPIPVTLNNVNPGQTYYFFIDGCYGTQCKYWLEITSGGGIPTVIGPDDVVCDSNFPNCQNICVGADVTFNLVDVYNASHYDWVINGGSATTTSDPELTTSFSNPGTYTISVHGYNDCSMGDPLTFTVDVIQLPPEDLGVFQVCENDLVNGYTPTGWQGGPLTSDGVFSNQVQNNQGCTYDQLVEIQKLIIEEQVIDTVGCTNETMQIAGETFAVDVTNYNLLVDNAGTNGCDKRLKITIHFLNSEGYLVDNCTGNALKPINLSFNPNSITPYDNIIIHWFKNDIAIPDDDNTNVFDINLSENGYYDADIELIKNGISCYFDNVQGLQIDLNNYLPPAGEAFDWVTNICNNSTEYYDYGLTNTNSNYTYHWFYPNDVYAVSAPPDSTRISIKWLNSTGGDVCFYTLDPLCGSSDTICQHINVTPAPNSLFTYIDTICVTGTDMFAYTGNASNLANYTWNFGGGLIINGTGGAGIGPHEISWTSPGTKSVTLQVEENGCVSQLEQHQIEVVNPPTEPAITCTSTATSILFEWDTIVGATNVNVNLLQGQTGTQSGNSYLIDGINPLDSATIQLYVQTNGICPNFYSNSLKCKAQDCPILNISLLPNDTTICLTGSNTPFKIKYNIVPFATGDILFSGPGIIDTLTGLFDPVLAGVGKHQIKMKFVANECNYFGKANITINEKPTSDFIVSKDTICIDDNVLLTYIGNTPSGNPTWNLNGGIVKSGSGLQPQTIGWNSIGLKNISLNVEKNTCVSDLTSKKVLVQDTLKDIEIKCKPFTDTIGFTWKLDNWAESYIIYVNNVKKDSLLTDHYSVNGLTPGDVVTLKLVAKNKGVCENKVAVLSCTAQECPHYNIQIAPNVDTICLNQNTGTIKFQANVTGGTSPGTIVWSGTGIDPNTGIFDPKSAGPGNHIIKMNYSELCDADTSFTVKVIQQPIAQFSVEDDHICISDSIVINYNNTNPSTTAYTWNFDGGVKTNITSNKFYLKFSTPGSHIITMNAENQGCKATGSQLSITVDPLLIPPVLQCVNATTNSVNINWNDINCASKYIVYVNGVKQDTVTNTSFSMINLNSNTTINFKIEALSECSCKNVSSIMSCATLPCPVVNVSISNLPDHLCKSDVNQVITLNATVNGATGGILTWSGNNINDNGAIDIKNFAAGKYIYNVKYDLQNCNYTASDSLIITDNPEPSFSKNDPLCHNDINGLITINAGQGLKYTLDGNSPVNGMFSNLASGIYTLNVTDQLNCSGAVQITLNNPPTISPDISGKIVVEENQTNRYEVKNIDSVNVKNVIWYLIKNGYLCEDACDKFIDLKLEDSDTLCVDIIDQNECKGTSCIALTYLEKVDIDIPNIFTPNGDNLNDRFFVKTDKTVELIKEMKIYDRWGELVFSATDMPVNNEAVGWDGKFKGKKVNPGVYVYYIVFKLVARDDLKVVGDVTIVK